MGKKMKYFYIFLICAFMISADILADESTKISVRTNNSFKQQMSNKQNIAEMTSAIEEIQSYIISQTKCTTSGLVFLGEGATNTNADSCFDLDSTTGQVDPNISIRPTIAGKTNVVAFLSGGSSYDSTWRGRLAANYKCENLYPESRAATFEDLKYIIKDLHESEYNGMKFWIFDAANAKNLAKNNSVITNINNCAGWLPSSTSDIPIVIDMNIDSGTPSKLKTIKPIMQ